MELRKVQRIFKGTVSRKLLHGTFDQLNFAELLRKGKGERSFRRYAEEAGISPSYFSRLERCLLSSPPEPSSLWAIAIVSHNGVTYEDLMKAAGHISFQKEERDLQWEVRALRAEAALNRALAAMQGVVAN